jgi:hypothetical protein
LKTLAVVREKSFDSTYSIPQKNHLKAGSYNSSLLPLIQIPYFFNIPLFSACDSGITLICYRFYNSSLLSTTDQAADANRKTFKTNRQSFCAFHQTFNAGALQHFYFYADS